MCKCRGYETTCTCIYKCTQKKKQHVCVTSTILSGRILYKITATNSPLCLCLAKVINKLIIMAFITS